MSDVQTTPPKRRMSPILRHTLELGPVAIFLVCLHFTNVFLATGVLMGLMTLSAIIDYAIERRVSGLILFGLIMVLTFGTLTLVLRDDTFIKIRPSIYFATLAVVLVGGLAFDRLFIKSAFEYAFQLDEAGWRKLTWRMGGFLVFLAIANHLVWTNFPDSVVLYGYRGTEVWGFYKLFGVPVLMMLFMMSQTPLLLRHQIETKPDERPRRDYAPGRQPGPITTMKASPIIRANAIAT